MNKYIERNNRRSDKEHGRLVKLLEDVSYTMNKKNSWLKRVYHKLHHGIMLWVLHPRLTFKRNITCRLGLHKFSWEHFVLDIVKEPGRVSIGCDFCSKVLGEVAFDDLRQFDCLSMMSLSQSLHTDKKHIYYN